jgi:hypothetical protein
VPKPLPLANNWTFVSGDAFYYQPTWNNNAAVRNENYAKTFVGDGWINTYEYYTGPLGYGTPGSTQGEFKTGIIRSGVFTIQGNSMSALVGGRNLPDECYVALVDNVTKQVLFTETGNNSNEMTLRSWDVRPFQGKAAYIEIADLSTVGHVCADEIVESYQVIGNGNSDGNGNGTRDRPGTGFTNSLPAGDGDSPDASTLATGPARLYPNTPNPFNPVTAIKFALPRAARVRLDVFDATGARVRTLADGTRAAGLHNETWTGIDDAGRGVSSGIYFYRLSVDGAVIDTRKMVLLK